MMLSHCLLNNDVYNYRPGCFRFGQRSLFIWHWSIKRCIKWQKFSEKKKELSAQPNTRQLCCTPMAMFQGTLEKEQGMCESWRMGTNTEMLSSEQGMGVLILIIHDWLSVQYQARSNHDTESILQMKQMLSRTGSCRELLLVWLRLRWWRINLY